MMGMLLNIKMERSLVGGRKGISLLTLLRDKVKEVRSVTAGGKQTWSRTYVQEALVGRSMEAPGAWARAHERPTGAAMAAVPRVVRTGCSICQQRRFPQNHSNTELCHHLGQGKQDTYGHTQLYSSTTAACSWLGVRKTRELVSGMT